MAAKSFNINNKEFVIYANKLEKLGRSDFPLAVRGTLNDLAFDMKIKQVPRQFKGRFVIRKRTFINSHTTVLKCKNTFDVKQMRSTVGIIGGKSDSGDELVNQEFGGSIRRDYIPTKEARISKSSRKVVSKKNYYSIVKAKGKIKAVQSNDFRKAAIKVGEGGYIKYGNLIYLIKKINKKGRNKLFIKAIPLYKIKLGRMVRIKRKPFMAPAAKISMRKSPSFFKKHFEHRLKKYYK